MKEPRLTTRGIHMGKSLAEGLSGKSNWRSFHTAADGVRADLRLCSIGGICSGGAVLTILGSKPVSYRALQEEVQIRLPRGWTQDTLNRACSRAIHRIGVVSRLEALRDTLYQRVEAAGLPQETLEALSGEMRALGITDLYSEMTPAVIAAWHHRLDEEIEG